MAVGDPVEVVVPATTWTKVATNITSGQISILAPYTARWYWTQRATGGSAPTTEAAEVRFDPQNLVIDSSVAIDVYVYQTSAQAGRVRVV